jgi:hypothetical protein
MNRANQQQLFQEANQGVINIRQTELNYYINLFTVFGTNAAIIGGFTYGILTQNIINYSSKIIDVYKFFYYFLAAMTIASSVHVVICTMLVQVYGPGLALNGPLGSMSRAAEGMAQEQKQIIWAVILMVASFASATIWLFFVIMNFYEAVASSTLFLIVAYYWYYYCERIYLRFYWKTQDGLWNGTAERDSRMMSDDDDPANPRPVFNTEAKPPSAYKKKKIRFSMKWGWGKNPTVEEEGNDIEMEDNADGQGMYGNKVLNYLFRNPANMSNEQRESITSATPSVRALATNADKESVLSGGGSTGAGAGSSVVAMEGYFTTRGRSEQQVILESRRWDRQYFVLFRTGEFYVYKSRQNFRTDPKSPVYNRSVRLVDFHVKVDNTDQEMRSEFEDDGRSVASTAITVRADRDSKKPLPFRFQITLVPRENEEAEGGSGAGRPAQLRNQWLLRCDTEEELEIWLGSIREVCPSCFVETR